MRTFRLLNRLLAGALLAALLSIPAVARAQADLRTVAEESGFSVYTPHDDLIAYMEAVQALSLDMRLGSYGTTFEGRDLPYAVFSRPMVREPWEAMVSGKPIVVLAANIHGGERTFRESLLILIRELATRGSPTNQWLDDLVVVVVPTMNPDGFMNTPRPIRGNAWGIDMNRDYMKLEMPSLVQFVQNIMQPWRPHVVVDGHNGGSFPYNVTYLGPSAAASAPEITALCDHEIFPLIDRNMERAGYQSFYYSGGNEQFWRTGGSDPRIGRNYLGMVNAIGILFESPPAGQTMEVGVKSGVVGYRAVIQYARENPDRVLSVVNRARREAMVMGEQAQGQVPVQQTLGPEDFSVTYQAQVGPRDAPRLVTVTSDSLMKKPIPTLTRDRAYAYLLPREAVEAVALLRRHGIALEVLREGIELEVQAYRIDDISWRREYDHQAAVVVRIAEVVTLTQRFPAGTYVVPVGQMMGRVVSHLMEPETDDNIYRWNTMDAWLPLPQLQRYQTTGEGTPPELPVFKLMSPHPLPTRLLGPN